MQNLPPQISGMAYWSKHPPATWKIRPLKYVLERKSERNRPNAQLLSVYRDYGVVLRENRDDNHNRVGENLDNYLFVEPGDLVINKMKAWQGSLGVSKFTGIVSPAYHIYKTSNNLDKKYLHHILRSEPYFREYAKQSKGIRTNQWDLDTIAFGRIPLMVPPLHTQRQIATFLDRKTEAIDTLIEKKQQLIERLEEKRTALINHVVTKGLDPDAPMKDSGIEWIGEVPRGWDVAKFGYLCKNLQTGPFGSQLHADEYVSNQVPVINPSNMEDGRIIPDWTKTITPSRALDLTTHHLCEGDIIFARRGELGRHGVVQPDQAGWICGTGSLKATCKTGSIIPQYGSIWLSTKFVSSWLNLQSVGSTMPNLNTTIVSNLPIILPNKSIQTELVRFISKQQQSLSKLTTLLTSQIEKLQEHRQALITAAVTGQIDVSGEVVDEDVEKANGDVVQEDQMSLL